MALKWKELLIKKLLIASCVYFVPWTGAFAASEDASKLVSYLVDELGDIRGIVDNRETAKSDDDTGWFAADADDYQSDLDAALDEALDLVAPDVHDVWSGKLEKIEDAFAEAEALKAELLIMRYGAPVSEGVGMVDRLLGREHEKGSLEDIESRRGETDAAIAQLESDRTAAIAGFAAEMRAKYDIDLTMDQAKALLFPVNGAVMVEAAVVVETLADVEQQLAAVMNEDIGAEAVRTYVGAASLTRLLYARMLARHLASYDGDWLPKLREIRARAESLLGETQQAAAEATQDQTLRTYENNIAIQQRILRVTLRYEEMLLNRREDTRIMLRDAEEAARAAVNTLLTLETASAVSVLMADSFSDYQTIKALKIPELETLDAEELDQPLDISEQLNS